ncbi:MAG TPA: hypothetical protein VMW01_11555 [Williamwhitmania sp.]|nr:hypothetical protein [Williamwhitmania sp.]
MKNTLQAIYLKIDTTSKSLAKNALSQLILKILFLYDKELSINDIKNEINSLLDTNIKRDRVEDALNLLIEENKIQLENENYSLSKNRKRKIDIAYQEYNNRILRIIDKFFSPVKSEKTAVRNWFETVTIQFFTEYKSEWIAEKAYKVKKENSFEGLSNIIDTVTKKDKNIIDEDKEWLKKQYFKFFNSSDDDVISIFWDFGTCAFSSTLITANTSVDKLTLDSFRNSLFILDTNILMYLHLEEGLFYNSYESLEKIFKALNITPGVFKITRDEYVKTIGNKRDDILRIIEKFDDDVIEQLDDAFIKTAQGRQCVNPEDFAEFFDDYMDVPDVFVNEVKVKMFDDRELDDIIEKGQENESLIQKLNEIYRNRHKYKKNGSNNSSQSKVIKDKRKRPLMHDAGLISGAEFLRKQQNCFILSRDITVKQYGIENALRDEQAISIGLDSLISMFALDNGGIDIDPTNFKPLFANIIKLALIPERDTFQLADLARMLDVEEQISELPSADIIEIAKGVNKNKLIGLDDEKITVELTRSFQNHKLKLKRDLDASKKETLLERGEKDKYKKTYEKTESALRKKYYDEFMQSYENKLLRNRILFYIVFPIITIGLTFLVIYLTKKSEGNAMVSNAIGLIINILAWIITSIFVVKPKLRRTYKTSVSQIEKDVERKMNEI